MDRGAVWWGTTNGYGLTWLSVRLIEQGIRLHYGRVHHPQTQGKVERFHRTWRKPCVIEANRSGWASGLEGWKSFVRLTTSDGGMKRWGCSVPRERYRASARVYQAAAAGVGLSPWERGAAAEPGGLFELGRTAMVRVRSAGRTSGCAWRRVGKLLLVSYRHMYVREINPLNRAARGRWVVPRRVGRISGRPPGSLRALPTQKSGERNVTDVLTPAVTHVLTPNSIAVPGADTWLLALSIRPA